MIEPSPEALLAAIANGCTDSLSKLYDNFASSLFGIAYGITKNHAEAQEVLQDAFVAIWKKADHYNPSLGKASSWIIHLTRNLSIDHIRKRQRREKMMTRASDEPEREPSEPHPSSPLIASETATRIRNALRSLPDDQRIALELAFFEGLSQTEISEKLEIPLGTIKSRIRRAMERVRSVLSDLTPDH